jgi:tetratricopeptide (TPR) repeat protein
MKGRYDKAVEDLSKIKVMDPGFSWTYYHLGISYLRMGKKRPAVLEMQEAARLGNNEARRWLKERRDPRGSSRLRKAVRSIARMTGWESPFPTCMTGWPKN